LAISTGWDTSTKNDMFKKGALRKKRKKKRKRKKK